MCHGEKVGGIRRIVDRVRGVHPALQVDAEPTAGPQVCGIRRRAQRSDDRRVGVCLAPERPREDGAVILVTGDAHRAFGRDRSWPCALAIVVDELELEASGRVVVADDLEQRCARLVADVEAVARKDRAFALAGNRSDDARRAEEIRRCGGALERAAERDQHRVDTAARRAACALVDPPEQRLERKRHTVAGQFVEERTSAGRYRSTWLNGIDGPHRCRRRGVYRGDAQRRRHERGPQPRTPSASSRFVAPGHCRRPKHRPPSRTLRTPQRPVVDAFACRASSPPPRPPTPRTQDRHAWRRSCCRA